MGPYFSSFPLLQLSLCLVALLLQLKDSSQFPTFLSTPILATFLWLLPL